MEKNDRLLSNLLAAVHRDGGHHEDSVGTEQAVKDAIDKVQQLRDQVPDCMKVVYHDNRPVVIPMWYAKALLGMVSDYNRTRQPRHLPCFEQEFYDHEEDLKSLIDDAETRTE